ncbi:MAG: enoyl-CoA hydratase/isomerase family protein [Deltaproteobacteria bacterium]|nr:enoyl-CoA hydratase/isomerase family protein [Deltaproteobacteria bacterium]
MEQTLLVETTDGIARLTLNRPEAFNAFDLETMDPFGASLLSLAKDPGVAGVVITGAGRAFSAGGDLRWLSGHGKGPAEAFPTLAASFHKAVLEIRSMPKPVVAAVNGLAAGGGFSLALACDFRVMAASAVLRQGYTTNGLSPDGGCTYTLPRLTGIPRAVEILTFDPPISAEKALSWGLVNEVVEEGKVIARAVEMIERIRQGSLTSFAAIKTLINEAFQGPLERVLERERELLACCADHPNGREGVAAFLEKRKPVYR